MQVPTRLSLILTVALLVGTLAASGTVGARLVAKRRAAALASADAHRREPRAPSAAPPEASAHAATASEHLEGGASGSTAAPSPGTALSEARAHASMAEPGEGRAHTSTTTQPASASGPEASAHGSTATELVEGGAHTSTVTQPPSHALSADPERALPLPSHSAAEELLPRPPEPTARSKARDGVRARGVAPVIATASRPDWDDEERPPPGPPPPVARPERPGPVKERARPAPGAARAPIVVPRSVNEWGT